MGNLFSSSTHGTVIKFNLGGVGGTGNLLPVFEEQKGYEEPKRYFKFK